MRSWRSTCGEKCPPTVLVLSQYLPQVSAAAAALLSALVAGAVFPVLPVSSPLPPCPALPGYFEDSGEL